MSNDIKKKVPDTFRDINEFISEGVELNKILINVPRGIKFISDWPGFNIPKGHLFMDKTLCGCGFTEFCLRCPEAVIIASPRKLLLENKEEQHNYEDVEIEYDPVTGEEIRIPIFPVYYFKNEKEKSIYFDSVGIDKEEIQSEGAKNIMEEEKRLYLASKKMNLMDYIKSGDFGRSGCPKILVTYDSLHYVLDFLQENQLLDRFYVVIDEAQALFQDASFKPDIEQRVLDTLFNHNVQNVMYLSATPMMDRYLCLVDYFKDIPFYKLIWPEEMTEMVNIERRFTKSIVKSVSENVISEYKFGRYPYRIINYQTGERVYSKEVVIFVNSVTVICDIIKKSELRPEEVNIICAKSTDNDTKLKTLSRRMNEIFGIKKREDKLHYTYGKVPTKRDMKLNRNKMFTFCTRTAYLGADFYSTNATTVVCSNINVETLNVDIALDLSQILGRQRMEENLFRDHVLYYYQSKRESDKCVSEEDFINSENKRINKTNDIMKISDFATDIDLDDTFAELVDDARRGAGRGIVKNYITVIFDEKTGDVKDFQFNRFLQVSMIRAYEISRPEYQEKVLIRREYDVPDNVNFTGRGVDVKDENISKFREEYEKTGDYAKKLKVLCDYIQSGLVKLEEVKFHILKEHYEAVVAFGPEKLKAVLYRKDSISQLFTELFSTEPVVEDIIKTFEVGKKYLARYIKDELVKLYRKHGINRTPKATELKKYFEIKNVFIRSGNSVQKGYQIVGKL